MPGFDRGDDQGGDPVSPPPAECVVQAEGGDCEQAGSCADAAESAVALQGAAIHPLAETALGIRQGSEDDQGHTRGCQCHG
jgi:hypothetical protein